MHISSVYASFLILCVFLTVNLTLSTEFVPVLLWETAKSDELVPALPRINKETFKEIIQERVDKDPLIVIFAEQSLSPEDFSEVDSTGKKSFPLLVDIKSTAQVTYLPFVEDPINIVKKLHNSDVTQVSLNSFLKNPIVPKTSVLIINLNDVQDDETRINMLQRHDKGINTIYNQLLKDHTNILALLTAQHTSWIISEEDTTRQKRSLLQAKEDPVEGDNRRIFNTTNFLLYINSTAHLHHDGKQYELNNYMESQSMVDNRTLAVEFTPAVPADPTIRFSIIFESGYWSLQEIIISEADVTKNHTLLRVRNIVAPMKFSYQCTSQAFFSPTSSETNLTLPGMQLQAFGVGSNEQFGDAYFCVGFTTAPIWSGLFVTAILAIIMAIGLSMMMDIKTMDRFDDPKGKTIIINTSE